MCGITGILALDDGTVTASEICRMTDRLTHRGPDDAGYLFADSEVALDFGRDFEPGWIAGRRPPRLGFGHRRLSIIDRAGGHQPMADSDRAVWLSYNGELYNYRELRRELLARGHEFRSGSDTEVTLQAYLAYGLDAFDRLNGMYALALWDQRAQRLVLARDRFGVKPLYYTVAQGRLVFGSEIKALLAAEGVRPRLNRRAMLQHFTFQNTLDDSTFFEDVFLLPAGAVLVADERGVRRERQLPEHVATPAPHSADEAARTIRELLESSVTRQLMSDVPLGTFLSGGMDTGAISTVAARDVSPLNTFTCGFEQGETLAPERAFDERAAARTLADQLGTLHHEVTLGPEAGWRVLPELVWHLDEPRVGISYQNYYVSALVKQVGVTVVLSGTGGDELFAGYPWRYRAIAQHSSPADFARAYYLAWHRMVPSDQIKDFLSPASRHALGGYSTFDTFRAELDRVQAEDPVQRALRFDARTFLQGLFVVEDKLSMAHSIETRVPFMDTPLVSYARALPTSFLLDDSDSKIALKQAMIGLIPKWILDRPKTGFTPPEASWYRSLHMERIQALLLGSRAVERDYFQPAYLTRMLDEHASGAANHRFLIWSLLCFEWWNRLFLDGDPLPAPAAPPLDAEHVVTSGAVPERAQVRTVHAPAG